MFFNTGSDGIYVFEVKFTFEMLTVRGQQHSFSTHERMFLWKCQSFWDRKCLDLRGARTSNLRIHAECSNHLSYQGQSLLWLFIFIIYIAVVFFAYSSTLRVVSMRCHIRPLLRSYRSRKYPNKLVLDLYTETDKLNLTEFFYNWWSFVVNIYYRSSLFSFI